MSPQDRAHHRSQSFRAFALYFALAVLLLDRGLAAHPGYFIGREADPWIYMWFLRWWRYALANRVNPFMTDMVWAPRGFNLAWSAFVPLPAWIAIPIGRTLGEATAYNILCIIALPLAALSAFLLCRRVTGAFWPSVLGGYIFGFSPYMLGQMLGGHLNLIFAFPIPLAVLVGLRRLDGEISVRRFTLEIASLVIVQFLCGIELFATMTVFGGFALLVALIFFDGETRARLIRLIGSLAAAYAIAMLVVSPYLYYLFARGSAGPQAWPPARFTGDLLNLFVPTEVNLLGTFGFSRAITEKFSGDLYENGVYIGIPLLIVIEAYRRMKSRTPVGRFLIAMLAIAVVASFGPALRVAGRATVPMPWALFTMLPVISSALTARFAIYASLVISLIAAIWFTDAPARPSTKCFAALMVGLFFAPNPVPSFWISRLSIPAFFTDRVYANELEPREIVLPLPFPDSGKSMFWQARSDMYFRMAGGWTTTTPFEFIRMPVVKYFYSGIDLPEAGDQLKAYIARFGVQAVIADPIEPNFETFKRTLDSLGVAGLNEKGVWLYKIPRDSFAVYAKLPAAQVEARADALRFDAILEAAGKYLAEGHDLSKLSALELKHLDLLPRDWLVDPAPHAYFDWAIGPAPGGRIGIIVVGSYEGVRPLIERYRASASEIDYPGPTRWTPDSRPRLDVIKPLLVTFEAAHLAAAARKLRDSPPPERTTPFVAGVLAGLGPPSP
ncbi:MAG TPA: hypothetical protein VJX68_13625 [Candidatus Binatus sp.]|uniref:hypothetical protein n=1 Tax=Candidatus Binatus sp. TaxID=2811406 RepID=UPI002B47924D|nr:hypothetical protein [Candidatus Binatus sp.]HKN14225.1 hypothetical protein [Candidatus Binatus sp.]